MLNLVQETSRVEQNASTMKNTDHHTRVAGRRGLSRHRHRPSIVDHGAGVW